MKLQSKKEQLWSVSEQESLVPEITISDVRSGMKYNMAEDLSDRIAVVLEP